VDTRTKIISPQQALRLAEAGATVVSGYFDPLLAAHAQRLQESKGAAPLLVLIGTPPDPILPVRARAELVAALAAVDYVAEWTPDIAPHVRLEQEDAQRLDRLIEHVHQRQAAAR
jgi:bifunctional ADP-heptose synthase (sugar kinase/adenylyltransferase)